MTQKKLTLSQLEEVEWILNFYLYEDGINHDKNQINKVERIKAKLGIPEGEDNPNSLYNQARERMGIRPSITE